MTSPMDHVNDFPIPDLWRTLAPVLPGTPEVVSPSGPRWWWAGRLDVEGLAVGSLQAFVTALATGLVAAGRPHEIEVTSAGVAGSFASLDHLRVNRRPATGFGPLSGFRRAADGWLRLHANYPHHARALLDALGLREPEDIDVVLRERPAAEVERAVTERGGLAVVVRSPAEWAATPAGQAVICEPWVRVSIAPAPSCRRTVAAALFGGGGGPLEGLRVLDLTRVIAGPSASRLLGALGADVLRVDPPALPELHHQHVDTGFAKRSAIADLADSSKLAQVRSLAAVADAILIGYRSGSLARYGLDPASLRTDHPGLAVVALDAWGDSGPWADRRGFDSIVQAATGIADIYGNREEPYGRPGTLPIQALDHATGLGMAAAAIAIMSARQRELSGSAHLSLARTATELLSTPVPPRDARPIELQLPMRRCASDFGEIAYVPPPLIVGGQQLDYPWPPQRYGSASLAWR